METTELQAVLHNLDNNTQCIGHQIKEMNLQINRLYSQAENCRNTAESILGRANYEDDANRSADMLSQASAYLSRAEYYESSASQMELQIDGLRSELINCRNQYEYYMGEGKMNLENLKPAVEKLAELSGANYGRDKIIQTLEQMRQRLTFNQKLVDGCRQRIKWIDQI